MLPLQTKFGAHLLFFLDPLSPNNHNQAEQTGSGKKIRKVGAGCWKVEIERSNAGR
jgi:hypothetical protein